MKTQSYETVDKCDERLMLIELILKAQTATFACLKNGILN